MDLMPCTQPKAEMNNDTFRIFDLAPFLPGCKLLVNVSTMIVSLFALAYECNEHIVAQRILSETEMRVLLPLLTTPLCCPQEVLQASYQCTYDFLLRALLSSDVDTRLRWDELIHEQRVRLTIAHAHSRQRAEMKNVYNALFVLRQKFKPLGFTIRAKREGYYIAPLVSR
jgi:hypothetical protein